MARKADGDGKVAEGKLTTHLKVLMKDPSWWYHRFPDAGVCMGRIPKQPADYIVMYKGVAMLLEVKESKSETSVPASRFTQSPKMRRFKMAGGRCGFIVYFRYATEPYWIYVSLAAVQVMEKSLKVTADYIKYPSIELLMEDIRGSLLGV